MYVLLLRLEELFILTLLIIYKSQFWTLKSRLYVVSINAIIAVGITTGTRTFISLELDPKQFSDVHVYTLYLQLTIFINLWPISGILLRLLLIFGQCFILFFEPINYTFRKENLIWRLKNVCNLIFFYANFWTIYDTFLFSPRFSLYLLNHNSW